VVQRRRPFRRARVRRRWWVRWDRHRGRADAGPPRCARRRPPTRAPCRGSRQRPPPLRRRRGRREPRPGRCGPPRRAPLETLDEQAATVRAGPRVTVELHPVTSLDWGAWQLPASKEARMNNLLRNYN
jgi:hypothetical protein